MLSRLTDALASTCTLLVLDNCEHVIASKGLRQISDEGAIERIVDDVLGAHPAIVAEFRAGKEKAFNSLVGRRCRRRRARLTRRRSTRS